MNKNVIPLLLLTAVAFVGIPQVLGWDNYLGTFESAYPAAAGSKIDSCALCHVSSAGGGDRNPYGTAFENNGYSFVAIEQSDSDGDGFKNIDEINAKTFPGDPNDPAPRVLTTIIVIPNPAAVFIGNTQAFIATGRDQYGDTIAISPAVDWSSSNTTVGTINSAGVFTAQAAGTTTITAASGSVNGTAIATIITAPLANNTIQQHLLAAYYPSTNCTQCHSILDETALIPYINTSHVVHLTSNLLNLKECNTCHKSVDLNEISAATLRRQVDPGFCTKCHSQFSPKMNPADKNKNCTTCHYNWKVRMANTTFVDIDAVTPNDCYGCHGGRAWYKASLIPTIVYYLPFLYQRTDNIYDAGVQIQNNGTIEADVEIQYYYLNGTSAGNGTFIVEPGNLITTHAFDITGTIPVYVGPAVVKSDVPVQVQGYIKTVSEGVYSIAPSLTDTVTNAYIPFLYQRADNIYDAGIMAFNPGSVAANVTINLYYLNGTLAAQNTTQIGPKAEVSKYVFDIVTGQSIFVGPAEIISDQPIVAQGFIRTKASMIYSIAPSVSTSVLKAYLPFLYQRADNIYDSGVMAFNPGSVAANVTINMYYLNGSLAGSGTYQVAPKAEVSKYAFDIVTGDSIFVGPAEIISDQPITVQGFIRTKASMVYSIAPQVRKPVSAGEAHVPFLYQTVNASHDAGIMAMNPNSGTANIEITLYYPNGTKAGNISATVGSNAELSKYVFDIAPNATDFNGSAIVSADQPIVSQGFIRKKSTMIYSIAPPVER